MHNLISAFPLYNFLKYCNNNSIEKTILDCGAGGSNPPLSLFHEFGYSTYGIEISKHQLKKADDFCLKNNLNLNITYGDMTNISFEDESFGFLYSYNTSVHMRKKDFLKAISEFKRVLKFGGLCYLNILNDECDSFNQGIKIDEGQFLCTEDGEETLYSHYGDKEIEEYFNGFTIVYKEKRIVERNIDGEIYKSGYYDYILKKE